MERLQVAVAKAREARNRERAERPAPAPGQAAAVLSSAAPTTPEVVTAAWQALAEMKVDRAQLNRKRVVSIETGPEAGPYDLLRTRIIHQAQTHGWKRVAVVSPHSGCGKTTTVANLAFSFGRQRDLRTMLIDVDLRRPALATLLLQKPAHTMADVFEGRIPFAEHGLRYGGNLAFGLNRGPVRNPSELLQSLQTRQVLEDLDETYAPDLMIFDISPLMASDDNIAFLQHVDCAVLVAAAERTPMDQIDVAERQISELTNVMGIVLNKCRYSGGAYGYDYGGY
ncbi:MAG: CpsD/CapB family tyrosine-protein kinase [Gemmobacter sp.]